MNDQRLKINEIYVSVQGESTFAGLPCVFVRTTGCPLRCTWCDTTYAFYDGRDTTVADVCAEVQTHDVPLVEITGGEPLVQPGVLPLMTALCDAQKTVLLETSGAFDVAPVDPRVHIIMDIKCPDSGELDKMRWDNIGQLKPGKDEVKFVLASRADYEFARDTIQKFQLNEKSIVLLSVAFDKLAAQDVVQWMLADKVPARFQLQMHKFIWAPQARGV